MDESRYWRGRAALAGLELEQAAEDLHPAFHGAIRRGDDELGFRAALALAEVASRRAQLAVAEEWLDHAEDALQRGQLGEPLQAQLELQRGEALSDAGRHADGLRALDRALAMLQRSLGPSALEVARVHLLRGIALRDLGRIDEALAAFELDEQILRSAFGDNHPSVVVPINNRAATLLDLGRTDEALQLFERGLQIRLRAYGRDHARTAFSLSQIGEAHTDLRDFGEAQRALAAALAIRTRIFGPDHPDVAETETGLGHLFLEQHRFGEARRHLSEALRIRQAVYGDDHDVVASAHRNLADAEREAGELAAAERHLQRAEAIWRAHLPADHPKFATLAFDRGQLALAHAQYDEAAKQFTAAMALHEARNGPDSALLGPTLRALGGAELLRGRREVARAALERATRLPASKRPIAPDELAAARFNMAQALWPEEQVRARAEAEAAAASLRATRSDDAKLREVNAWLASH